MASCIMEDWHVDARQFKRIHGNIERNGAQNYKVRHAMEELGGCGIFGTIEDADADYVKFLTSETIALSKTRSHEVVNDEDVGNDPHYEIFWSSVKEYGNSYCIEPNEYNGLFESMIYEREDESYGELDQDVWRRMKNVKTGGDAELPSLPTDPFPSQDNQCSIGDINLLEEQLLLEDVNPRDDQCPVEDVNPHDHQHSVEDVNFQDVHVSDRPGNFDMLGGKGKALHRQVFRRSRRVADAKKAVPAVNPRDDQSPVEDGNSQDVHCPLEDVSPWDACASDTLGKIDMQHGKGKAQKGEALRNTRRITRAKKAEASRDIFIDEDYAVFLDSMRTEGSDLISKFEPSQPIVYEVEDEEDFQTSYARSSKKQKTEFSQHAEEIDDTVMEEGENCQSLGILRREMRSKFREQVISRLRMPYDIKEHKMLFLDVSARKPKCRHIDLRNGKILFYAGDENGKSYLDTHPSLKRKLAAAKDEREKLSLLRGFFFWLRNLTRDGAFQPWEDKACLAVLPQETRSSSV